MNGHLRRLLHRLTWCRFERQRVIRYHYRRRVFFVNARTAPRLVLALAISNNNQTKKGQSK